MSARKTIKKILIDEDMTLTDLVSKINEEYEREDTVQNLSNKLRRGTLKYREAEEIADILGYEIKWIKK